MALVIGKKGLAVSLTKSGSGETGLSKTPEKK
jgi:hypothetical protein